MIITHAKRIWLIASLVVTLAVLAFFVFSSNWLVSGVESRLVKNGRLSVQGYQTVVDATKSSDESQLKLLLEQNPGLARYLNSELQGLDLQNEWGQSQAIYFSRVSSSLRHLLEGAESSLIKQTINDFSGGPHPLATYLDAFINVQQNLGKGYISSLSDADQQAVGEAIRLLASLNDGRDIQQELVEIAAWYTTEKSARTGSATYLEWLLQYAWELSWLDLDLDPTTLGEEVLASLKKDTDLTRLLNHQNDAVVKNTAKLISVFAPKNTITALRFQLIRSNNNQERYLLLDAIKSYGEQRSEVEIQLKKMLRLTRDTNLQEKIMETIDHLNGRSNTLLTKSD